MNAIPIVAALLLLILFGWGACEILDEDAIDEANGRKDGSTDA